MSIGSRIKQKREECHLTQADLAIEVGVTASAVSAWEIGEKCPRMGVLQKIADYFNVTKSYFIEDSKTEDSLPYGLLKIEPRRIKLLGDIAAGLPIYADEEYDRFVMTDSSTHVDFALRVVGDSMIKAGIEDGDIVFIRQQSDVDDGQIAVVLIGDEATLKRVYHGKDNITLVAENSKYPPQVYGADSEVRILGLAVMRQTPIV